MALLFPVITRSKSDFLSFRLQIAEQLLYGYSSRKKAGHPRSSEYNNLTRLNIELGHWPIKVEEKKDCKLCAIRGNKQNLPRSEWRHQSRVKCSACDVHLCLENERHCFMEYHTEIEL